MAGHVRQRTGNQQTLKRNDAGNKAAEASKRLDGMTKLRDPQV